jgi:alanine racemase
MQVEAPGRPWQVRQTSLEIDLGRLKQNYVTLSRRAHGGELLILLKSNAYGHSHAEVSKALESLPAKARLHGYGVANVEEGIELRREGVSRPVLIMSGIQQYDEELDRCLETCSLTPVIASLTVLEDLARTLRKNGARRAVHLKFNTGMNRLGFDVADVEPALRILAKNPAIEVVGLLSHLAIGENPRAPLSRTQVKNFRGIVSRFAEAGIRPPYIHLANSGGLATDILPEGTMARVGLHIYGVGDDALKPVARWTAQVYQVRDLAKGELVGYGGRYRAKKAMRMAVLGVGYGDGYRRAFSNKAEVLLKGKRCPVIGSVSMDLTAIDISRVPNATTRDRAVLLGADGRDEITAEELAAHANTISWEILTGISPRVPRVFVS